MNTKEQDRLAKAFDEVSSQIDDMQEFVSDLEKQYPGLGGEPLYTRLLDMLLAAVSHSSELAKYIRTASDEDWKPK